MKIRNIAFVCLALTTLIACSHIEDEKDNNQNSEQASAAEVAQTTVGHPGADARTAFLPAFKVRAMDGSVLKLSDLKGKKVFVNLWATWCPPCRKEIPSIVKLYSKVDKQKVAFVMLSLDENFELAKNFVKENRLALPVYYPAEALPAMFNTDGIPATFIFSETGELIKVNNGMDDYDTAEYVQMLR